MRALLQRVKSASVTVENSIISSINNGLLVLVGFTHEDQNTDLERMANKVVNLRIFNDENGVMNRSLLEKNGDLLLVSQFTLYAQCAKGNRPSYIQSAPRAIAEPLYEQFSKVLERMLNKSIQRGIFGADMQVSLINDGPVTIILP
jgi:D-tyrosyl-tRNA(Tyr) deacylase